MSKYLRTANLTAVQHQDIILSATIKNLPRTWTCVGLHIIVSALDWILRSHRNTAFNPETRNFLQSLPECNNTQNVTL